VELGRRTEGKRLLRRPRSRYEDNIRVGKWGKNACGSERGSVSGCCEHGNELSGSTKGREFLDWLSDC